MGQLSELEAEARRNYEAFTNELQWLLNAHSGEYVLLRNTKIIGFFAEASDAHQFGSSNFVDGVFTIQKITDRLAFTSPRTHAITDRST